MKKNSLTLNISYISLLVAGIILFGSCAPVKNVVYFENLGNDTILHNVATNNFEVKIKKNDLLYIGIVSPDPVSTILFNAPQGASTSTASGETNRTSGYLVDNNGNITLYKLGSIHVEGLTRNELRQRLQRELTPYLKDAVVTIPILSRVIISSGALVKCPVPSFR